MLGDGRLALQCYDDVARTGLIRGTMRRRVWINIVSDISHFFLVTVILSSVFLTCSLFFLFRCNVYREILY